MCLYYTMITFLAQLNVYMKRGLNNPLSRSLFVKREINYTVCATTVLPTSNTFQK